VNNRDTDARRRPPLQARSRRPASSLADGARNISRHNNLQQPHERRELRQQRPWRDRLRFVIADPQSTKLSSQPHMAHWAGLDGRHPGVVDGPCVAQGGSKPVGGDSVGICRNAHEKPYIRASAALKAVDQLAVERDMPGPHQARPPPSRGHSPADRTPLGCTRRRQPSRALPLTTVTSTFGTGGSPPPRRGTLRCQGAAEGL